MAKLLCVFSTLTASVEYTEYAKATDAGGMPRPLGSVLVKGGAGVANEFIQTPRGVATMVTEAQAELLKRNSVFQMHQKNGFVVIDAVDRPPGEDAIEKAVADMTSRDNSAPLVDADFTANDLTPPTVSK